MTPPGAPAPRIDHYDWPGGREAMLRFGPVGGATALVALPLLEEANRTRALAVAMLRRLAERGIGGALPELPGTGESEVPTEAMRLADLRAAFAAAGERVGRRTVTVAIRSGALFVPPARDRPAARPLRHAGLVPASTDPREPTMSIVRKGGPRNEPGVTREGTSRSDPREHSAPGEGEGNTWMLSPQTGAEVVREWRRLRDAGDGATIAGNRIAADLWTELATAEPPPARVIRLAGDPRPADRVVAAPPLWRRAEPDADLALAALLADDVADWIVRCGG